MNNLVSYLFKTNAVNICPENKPFWYTSGKIGPYYINSEFLYGSKEDSIKLLDFINLEKENKMMLPKKIFEKVKKQYDENEIFHNVINEMKEKILKTVNIDEINYISGGERRDWFFSYMISNLLNKPHITIFKDLEVIVSDCNFENTNKLQNINGAKVLHVADLVTEASSYFRAWIPSIENLGANILYSICVIDRMQGGSSKLEKAGINCMSIFKVQKELFDDALKLNVFNEEQYKMVCEFIENPDETMKNFVESHPEFIEDSLNSSDEKTASRAKLCIEKGWYK